MLALISVPPSPPMHQYINTILYGKKNGVLLCISFGQVREKKLKSIHDVAPCQCFFFYIPFPPHENSFVSQQLNWTLEVIYVGCAKRKGFVRFQGGHERLRVRNSLAETWGITSPSLNLHAYDQTQPHFAFAA